MFFEGLEELDEIISNIKTEMQIMNRFLEMDYFPKKNEFL